MDKKFQPANLTKQVKLIFCQCSTKRFLTLIILLLFMFVSLSAQSSDNKTITLQENSTIQDYLTYAAINSPELKAAFYRWKAAIEKVVPAKSLPNPQFTFAYYIRHVETRVGPQQNRFGIMQMFPWFGKLKYKGKAASAGAQAIKEQYENQKLKLFSAVKNRIYEIFFINKQVSILNENLQWLQSIEKIITTRYSTGMASHAKLVKVQLELDRLNDRLESTQQLLVTRRIDLNTLLNHPINQRLPIPRMLSFPSPELNINQLNKDLLANNRELKSLQYLTRQANFGVGAAKANYLPDFSLGINTITTGPAINADMPESGKDPIIAMATIHIPLWFNKNRALLKGARARYQASLNREQSKINQLFASLRRVYFQYQDAVRKIKLYKKNLIPKARQALAVTQIAFTTGKSDILNLIDSQRTLLSLQVGYEQSRARSGQKLAELEMMVGKNLGD